MTLSLIIQSFGALALSALIVSTVALPIRKPAPVFSDGSGCSMGEGCGVTHR